MPSLDEIRAVIAEEVAKVLRTEGVSGAAGHAKDAAEATAADGPLDRQIKEIRRAVRE